MFVSKENTKKGKDSFNQGGTFFQPKLTINQPDDVYEQEADARADKVMRQTDPRQDTPLFFKPANTQPIQPKSSEHKGEDEKQKEDDEGKEENISEEQHPIADLPVQRKCAHCEEEEEKKISRKE